MAPNFHPAMKHAAPVRRALGFRTIFNLVGPLANPASANVQTIGVPDAALVDVFAQALRTLGTRRSFVVHGQTDELTPCGPNVVREIQGDRVREFTLTAKDFGLKKCAMADLGGGMPKENAEIARRVLASKPGPARDVVVMNAGAALVAAGRAGTWDDGADLALAILEQGEAKKKLDDLIAFSNGGR